MTGDEAGRDAGERFDCVVLCERAGEGVLEWQRSRAGSSREPFLVAVANTHRGDGNSLPAVVEQVRQAAEQHNHLVRQLDKIQRRRHDGVLLPKGCLSSRKVEVMLLLKLKHVVERLGHQRDEQIDEHDDGHEDKHDHHDPCDSGD
eukprot:4081748-Prymnesium_polylepis.2